MHRTTIRLLLALVTAALAGVLAAGAQATHLPTTGDPVRLLNPATTPATFPANAPFFVRHGFTCAPEEVADCLNPGTDFRLYVDGRRIRTAVDLHPHLDCAVVGVAGDWCAGKANLANFGHGLPPGPHRFRGEWWVNGTLADDAFNPGNPLVREATIVFVAA